jgi:hypothetical protein
VLDGLPGARHVHGVGQVGPAASRRGRQGRREVSGGREWGSNFSAAAAVSKSSSMGLIGALAGELCDLLTLYMNSGCQWWGHVATSHHHPPHPVTPLFPPLTAGGGWMPPPSTPRKCGSAQCPGCRRPAGQGSTRAGQYNAAEQGMGRGGRWRMLGWRGGRMSGMAGGRELHGWAISPGAASCGCCC